MNELKMSAVSVSQPSELKIESFYATLNNHLVNSVFFLLVLWKLIYKRPQ